MFLSGNITIELLVGYIEGSLNDPHRDEVHHWLETDPANWEFFNRFKEAWSNPQELIELSKENQEKDWSFISMTLHESDKVKSGRNSKRLFSRWWIRVAAVFVMFLSITGGYYLGRNTNRPLSLTGGGYHEIVVPAGEKSKLILSDGTKVWINAGSTLRLPNQFNYISRDIWLDGEAYFEVTHDKVRPFLVHTSDLDIRALGTKFNVKAYSDEDVIEATLIEGLISLETWNIFNNRVDEVFVQPNHKAIFVKKKNPVISDEIIREIDEPLRPKRITISKPIQVEQTISWREGKLVFIDETFENIASKLERRFGVSILIENEQIKKVRYTGVLKNISVEQALKAIQFTARFNYSIHDNTIIITDETTVDQK